jgi:hypothetical protein
MSTSKIRSATLAVSPGLWILVAFFADIAQAQMLRYEVTPLVGGRAGGSMNLQEEGQPPIGRAHLADSVTFGVAAGFHFWDEEECEDCSLVEFRWMRQHTHLGFKEATPVPVPTPLAASFSRTAVTLDHYLADFTHEWNLEQARSVRPFLMASIGASRMSTAVSANTRFAFGVGGGVKVFPHRHWGFRFHVEYLPTVMRSEFQRVSCCVFAVGGEVISQFEFAIGPVFRF